MEAKQFLKQYQETLRRIHNMEAEAEELETMAMSITSHVEVVKVKCGEDKFEEHVMNRVQSSGNQDSMGDLIARIIDFRNEIMEQWVNALNQLEEIEAVIWQVDDSRLQRILHMRYVENRKWEEIAVESGFSYRQVLRIHGQALQAVKKLLDLE